MNQKCDVCNCTINEDDIFVLSCGSFCSKHCPDYNTLSDADKKVIEHYYDSMNDFAK